MDLRTTDAGGEYSYLGIYVGQPEGVVHLSVDVSTLTTDEVDAKGFLKPGVCLTPTGKLVGGVALAGTAVAAAVAGNTGNGTCGAVTVSAGAKAGVYTLTILEPGSNVGAFVVEDPDGIPIGNGDVATAFSAGGLAFTLADGATDFVAGDQFTITVTLSAGGDRGVIGGVVFEAKKLLQRTDNASLSSDTNDTWVAVLTSGTVRQSHIEKNLGRSMTATEIAAFAAATCKIKLLAV